MKNVDRNITIYKEYISGKLIHLIAKDYSISVGRVSQLVNKTAIYLAQQQHMENRPNFLVNQINKGGTQNSQKG